MNESMKAKLRMSYSDTIKILNETFEKYDGYAKHVKGLQIMAQINGEHIDDIQSLNS